MVHGAQNRNRENPQLLPSASVPWLPCSVLAAQTSRVSRGNAKRLHDCRSRGMMDVLINQPDVCRVVRQKASGCWSCRTRPLICCHPGSLPRQQRSDCCRVRLEAGCRRPLPSRDGCIGGRWGADVPACQRPHMWATSASGQCHMSVSCQEMLRQTLNIFMIRRLGGRHVPAGC